MATDLDIGGPTHNAAFKMALRLLLYESRAGVTWAFSDGTDEILKLLWDDAAQGVEESDRRDPVGMEAGGIYADQGYSVRIIRCPEPGRIAENHFVAIAWKPPRRHVLPWRKDPEEVRYLALESAFREDGDATILGEWTRDRHINYGYGPEPTEDAFVTAIRPILAREAGVVAVSTLPPG